jgi:enoyl-CoA hydratase
MSTTLLTELRDEVGVITLNRPDKLNAVSRLMLEELGEVFSRWSRTRQPRAVVLGAAGGRAFAAGADLSEMQHMSVAEAWAFSQLGHALARTMAEAPFPIIAAVDGYALGGGLELALAADLIYCSPRSRFGMPETTLGLMPGFGGTQRLARQLGVARAAELILTGATLDAEAAARVGLVLEIIPEERLLEESLARARSVASRGPLAVAAAKRALHQGADQDLFGACQLESSLFAGLFASSDAQEGMAAFLGKRSPQFRSR